MGKAGKKDTPEFVSILRGIAARLDVISGTKGRLFRVPALPPVQAPVAEPEQQVQQPSQQLKTGKKWIAEAWSNKDKRKRDELLALGITKASILLESRPPPDGKPVTRRYAEKVLRTLGYSKAFRDLPK